MDCMAANHSINAPGNSTFNVFLCLVKMELP